MKYLEVKEIIKEFDLVRVKNKLLYKNYTVATVYQNGKKDYRLRFIEHYIGEICASNVKLAKRAAINRMAEIKKLLINLKVNEIDNDFK